MHGRFSLNLSLWTPGQLAAAWRNPDNDPLAHLDPQHFVRLTRLAEDAAVHSVFVGDTPALRDNAATSPAGNLDPGSLFAYLAAVTSRIGFVATVSTTYNHPYDIARRFSTIDHLSGGRAGLNAVTTASPAAARNFGFDDAPAKSERYRRAEEFLQVTAALWDGWAPDAVIADQAGGVFADPARIRPAGFEGEFFRVAGALPVPRSPQGRPVLVQAGGSEGGRDLGARFADVIFTIWQTQRGAVEFRQDIRDRAARLGRSPDSIAVSLGVIVVVGDTAADAERRLDGLLDTGGLGRLARQFGAQLGLSAAEATPDRVLRAGDIPAVAPEGAFSQGLFASARALLAERPLTLGELVRRSIGSPGHRLIHGTAADIADDLEQWYRAGAADGFTIMFADIGVDFERFVSRVIPILQSRGLVQRDYLGSTFRENLGLIREDADAVTAPS